MGKNAFDFIQPLLDVAESAALTATGNPEFIPLAIGATNGISTGVRTGNPLAGLISGGASGAGSYIGSNLLGSIGAPAAGTTGSAGGSLAGTAGSATGPIANSGTSILSVPGQSSMDAFMSGGGTGSSNLLGNSPGLSGGGFGDSLAASGLSSGGGSTAGSSAGSGLTGALQTPMSNVISSGLGGGDTASSIGSTFGGSANVGNAIGTFGGGALGNSAVSPLIAHLTQPSTDQPPTPPPGYASDMALPGDLSGLGGLSPLQQSTNIATQGVYGGGVGGQDDQYFLNLINHQLVNGPGNYNPMSGLSPINNSFLSQLGLGGYGNSQDLLSAMNSWQPPST